MKSSKIVEGLNIIAKYYDPEGGDQYWICAEHDEIFAGHGLRLYADGDDAKKLEELGWDFDDSLDCWKAYV